MIYFLYDVIGNPTPSFNTNADGLDCTLKSSSGQKAGERFPRQAAAALCKACERGEVRVVKGMLAAGTDVNQCDKHDLSPLMHASTHWNTDVIDVLVSHGADVSFVNKKNQTSLLLACEHEWWHTAVALYQYIMATQAGKSTEQRCHIDQAFQIALQHHGVKYLQHVAENDRHAYDTLVNKVSLSDACKHGYDLVTKHHALHNCSQKEIIDVVKIALSNYQSHVLNTLVPHFTNSSVSELITYAYQQAQYSFAHALFESCTDHSALPCLGISITDACKARQVDVVEFLIKHGKDVNNAADELGYRLKYQPGDGDALFHVLKASAEDNQTDDNVYSPTKVDISLSAMNDHNCHPPLVYACMQGDISIVKLLLQHGADVSIHSNETPLTAACKHGHSDVVDILLHNAPKPSISQTNMYGMTPLQVAVKNYEGVIARKLVDIYEADTNVCKAPNTEFIKIMLMPQGDRLKSVSVVKLHTVSQDITSIVPEHHNWEIYLEPIKTDDVGTPLIVAAFQSKQYDLVKFFIDCTDNYEPVELFKHATLEDICQLENVPFVQQFNIHYQLQRTEINNETVLDVIVKLGNTDLMTYFLQQYTIHSETLEKSMIQACQQGSHAMVDLLIQHDEDLVTSIQHDSSICCQHPLCIAIRNHDVNLTVTLHKSGAQLFNVSSSETPLHHTLCEYSLKNLCSRQDGFSDILPQLLPECIDQSSLSSALFAACRAGCTRAARLLVSKGADVNRCGAHGDSPLLAAIWPAKSSQLVTLLIDAGADPNIADNERESALYLACRWEHFEIASMLIDAGAGTNPKLCFPLEIACKCNYIDIVELLLENGADSNRPSSERDSSNTGGDYNDIDGNSNNTDGRIDGDNNDIDKDRNDTERESNDIVEPDRSSSEGDRNIILNRNDSKGDSNGIKGDNSIMDIVEPLLEHKTDANLSSSKGHILYTAHRYEHYGVARLLLEYGAEPSVLSGIGLKTACELGYTEVAQHIIHESHVGPDELGQCIESAYKNGSPEAVLEAIIDISEEDVRDHCIHLVRSLLSGETSILTDTTQELPDNVSDDMSLWKCLENRNIAKMRELIESGHDVNIPNITGRSLLQECIQQRITHVIPDLCASQIHTDHRDSAGRTALFYSLTCPDMHPVRGGESISVFEYLASKGADINVRDYFGRSVLHEWQPASDGLKHGPSLENLLQHINIQLTVLIIKGKPLFTLLF